MSVCVLKALILKFGVLTWNSICSFVTVASEWNVSTVSCSRFRRIYYQITKHLCLLLRWDTHTLIFHFVKTLILSLSVG